MVFCQNTMVGNIKRKKAASLMRDGPIYIIRCSPYSTTIGLYFGTSAFMMHQPMR